MIPGIIALPLGDLRTNHLLKQIYLLKAIDKDMLNVGWASALVKTNLNLVSIIQKYPRTNFRIR